MDEKQLQALYNAMHSSLDLGDYNTFKTTIVNDPKYRQAIYTQASEELDLGDYNTWSKNIGFDSQEVKNKSLPFLTNPQQSLDEATRVKEQPQQQPTNIDFNALRMQKGGSERPTSEQQNLVNYGTQITEDAIKKREEAIANTVIYKNEQNGIKVKEGSPEFNQQFAKTKEALSNGSLVQTTAKDGVPILTRGRGFWESAGVALGESFKTTWQGLKMNMMDSKNLANYLEEINKEQPYIPESLPSGVSGTFGEMAGGFPKMAAELSIPYAGLGIAAADALVSSQANITKQLYQENLKKETEGKELSPEQYQQAREGAAKKSINDAYYQAIPDAAVMTALGAKGGVLPAEERQLLTAGKTFVNTLKKAGGDVVKIGAIGGAAGGVQQGIKATQGYEVNLDDVVKTMSEGSGQWALMEATFKLLPVMSEMPSAVKASYKELLTNIPKPVLDNELAKLGEQGNAVKEELNTYQAARDKVKPFVNEEDLPSYAGLQEKRDALTQKKTEVESADVLPSVKANAIKSVDKEIASVDDQVSKMQETGKPLDHEKDNLTGEPLGKIEEPKTDVATIQPEPETKSQEPTQDNIGSNEVEKNSNTPIKDEYHSRLENLNKESKQSDVGNLGVGDFVNVPSSEQSSGVKGFVKKIGRTNVVLDTFYQLGSSNDEGLMQEITVKKSEIKEFLKPNETPKETKLSTQEDKINIGDKFISDSGQNYTIRGFTDKGGIQFEDSKGGKGVWNKEKFDTYIKEGRLKSENKTQEDNRVNESIVDRSILNQDKNLKGENKWDASYGDNHLPLYTNDELAKRLDKLKTPRGNKYTKQDKENAAKEFVNEVKDAIEKDAYNNAISNGDINATDVKKIIESAGLEVPKDILKLAENETTKETKDNTQENKGLNEPNQASQERKNETGVLEDAQKEEISEPPVPPTEPPLTPQEDSLQNGNNVGVSHAALTDLAKRLNLDEPKRGAYIEPEMYADRGRKLLAAGADPNEINNTNNTLHDRIAIGRAHLEDLTKIADATAKKWGVDSTQFEEAQKAVNDYSKQIKELGTDAHRAMVSLQGSRDLDTDSFTAVKTQVENNSGRKASPAQEKKIQELTTTNEKLKQQAAEAEAKLIEETEKAFQAGVEEGKKKSVSQKAKTVANKLRESAKLHKPSSFSAATPASLIWDAAIEVVAKGIEAGGKLADVIQEGIDHIKNSDWYKSLSDDKKQKAEQEFKQFNFDNASSNSLEDLQARFLDKKDNKFTREEAKAIWDYAKENYLSKGVSYRDTIINIHNDLGLTWRQVSEAISTPKTKRISDEMWKKQAEYRRSQNATKTWVDDQEKNPALKAIKKVSDKFRAVAVFGHGGIFMGTHAGMTLFQPTTWDLTIPAFFRGWKYAYGKVAVHEKAMEELKNSPNYVIAQRAGLKNNPDRLNVEEYQKSQKFLGKLGGAGERGFNAIKVLRQDLFDYHYNRLNDVEKADPKAVEQIAKLVNLATGATNLNIPEWVNEVTFAGGMEAARWGKWTRSPVNATTTALRALYAPDKVPLEDKVFAKVWASRVGQQLATFTSLLLANAAIQNYLNPKNPVNLTDPSKPDLLKFKVGDLTIDPTSGMRSAGTFIYGIGKIPFEQQKELRGDTRLQAASKSVFSYGRGKLSPAYATLADFYTGQDYNKNPLPFSSDKPTAGHHKLTWGEYAWQKAPLPIAEAATVTFKSAEEHGADKPTLNNVLTGVVSGAISGSTGFRVGEYNAEESNHSPFTEEDKKDKTFKFFYDKGMELPNTSLSSEEITDEDNKTKKKISDYPKDIQSKYQIAHKKALKENLSEILDGKTVYVKTYKDNQGVEVNQVSIDEPDGDYKEVEIDKLDKPELAQVLSIAQSLATKQAKDEVFYQSEDE